MEPPNVECSVLSVVLEDREGHRRFNLFQKDISNSCLSSSSLKHALLILQLLYIIKKKPKYGEKGKRNCLCSSQELNPNSRKYLLSLSSNLMYLTLSYFNFCTINWEEFNVTKEYKIHDSVFSFQSAGRVATSTHAAGLRMQIICNCTQIRRILSISNIPAVMKMRTSRRENGK